MKISEAYEKYEVPPWLQLHQLRVAAIGEFVAAFHPEVNAHEVVGACLLHDIGSIVKFDFSRQGSPLDHLYPPEEAPHWRDVQKRTREKYGRNEHPATDAIITELGLTNMGAIVSDTGFTNMKKIIEENRIAAQIVQYADMRVSPRGIAPLDERLTDVKERYAERLKASGRYDFFDENYVLGRKMESALFANAPHTPEDITEENMQEAIARLRDFELH